MAEAACCQCGAVNEDVRYVTPDLDITPVPLCLICYFDLLCGTRTVGGVEVPVSDGDPRG